ncbi:MATE family efflux transporter [Rikenella microfusus]|uniref:Multidrug-efflux transporter n=1 Tax=Rikenella microfusus TaxID=28139 RepID=A0A379MRC4_9BACT|nr:MATE family efflux transporter [Rikenella microfusus]SUE34274.1 Na(+)/drug antiporter [Rikenella microfusus]
MYSFRRYRSDYRELLRLGLPIMVGQLGVVVVGFMDGLMVGRYGMDDLAAVSFVNSVFNIPILFGLGFSYGLTPLVGQSFGTGDTSRIGCLLKNSLSVNATVGLLMMLLMGILLLNVDRMGQPAELLPLIRPYFALQLVSLLFVMLFNAFKQFADGITDTRLPMYIMIGGNIFNILGNYILIYGKLGFPALGATGAGISTLLTRILMPLVFAGIFFYGRRYARYRAAFRCCGVERGCTKKLAGMGTMVGLQMGIENGMFSVAGVMIGWLGKVELASHQVILSVSTLGILLYYGTGAAISIRVSHFFGRRDMKGVRRTTAAGVQLMAAISVVICGAFLTLRPFMGRIFNAPPEVAAIVSVLMLILLTLQVGDVFQVTYANALRGMNDVTSMAAISFVGYFVLALPLCYLFGFTLHGGIVGIWWGFPVGLLAAGLMMMGRFRYLTKNRETHG